jgi:hypothetical protein
MWQDTKLKAAGKAFAALVQAQRNAFAADKGKVRKQRANLDFAEKALNYAVLSSWAYK